MVDKVKKGDLVKFEYAAKLENGTVVDSSEGKGPVEVKVGDGNLMPGLEQALEGMEPGGSKTVDLSPEKGYGPHLQELVMEVNRELVPEDIDPQVGQQLLIRFRDGREAHARVADVNDLSVTLDANHPLAGKSLVVDLHLVEIV